LRFDGDIRTRVVVGVHELLVGEPRRVRVDSLARVGIVPKPPENLVEKLYKRLVHALLLQVLMTGGKSPTALFRAVNIRAPQETVDLSV
jgi:hypothetical protein